MKYTIDMNSQNIYSQLSERGDIAQLFDSMRREIVFNEDTYYDYFPFDDFLKLIEGSKVIWSLGEHPSNSGLGGFWGKFKVEQPPKIEKETFCDQLNEDRRYFPMSIGKLLSWGFYENDIFPFSFEDLYYHSAKLLYDQTEIDIDNYMKFLFETKLFAELIDGELSFYYELDH